MAKSESYDALVEAVAAACFGHWREHPQLSAAKQATAWGNLDEAFKATWRVNARSVIAVIRERLATVTSEMRTARGVNVFGGEENLGTYLDHWDTKDVWLAMLAASPLSLDEPDGGAGP